VAEFHSGCSEGQRIDTWRRCLEADGAPLLVVGTRSAVFLPIGNLGLIVLDEEHDSSYKQDSPMPCYHARDVARHRARRSGARLVLGSATPSLETWQTCQGPAATTELLRLPERIGGRPLPPVRLVDMRLELEDGHRRLISRPLMQRLGSLAERGEQAVLLVPRRGHSSFLSCRSCGEVVHCPNCDVALTVHGRSDGPQWLRCHWCDHRAEIGERCSHCGSTAFKPFGAGTQRVMEQLEKELEGLRLLRFDRDTTRGRDGHRRLLQRFAAGEADVLVGTQMLAKGMDLPAVTLAAVLAADGLLHRPDLRAGEQSLQLLLQLAGRAGRGDRPGEVLVQTYCPDHPVIRHLVDGRYEAFLAEELALRRSAQLVPFSRACLLRLAGPSASGTATAAASLAERIRGQVRASGWLLVGPAPAPIARVAGRSRWQLLLHGPAGSELPLPAEALLREGLARDVSLSIDPDPLEL
jgi:primosomal protein N' (replication factor Y)